MRVTSDFWVSALCRRVVSEGAFAYVRKRGGKEAGAIFVVVHDMQQGATLYQPAPQSWLLDDDHGERVFERNPNLSEEHGIGEQLTREQQFDPDIWIVEIEDREGRPFVHVLTDEPSNQRKI